MSSFLKCTPAGLSRLALLVFLLWPAARAERVQDLPRPQNYVSDFSGVLSPETAISLDRLCSAVDHQAHAQIAVVTIKTLDDVPIEDFATQLEDKWGVGPKKNDRGILIILATQDHKRRIEVGYGLEGVITDQQAGEIGRAMVPDLKAGSYDGAVTLAVNQIASRVAANAGVTLQSPSRGPPRQGRPMTLGQLLWTAGIFLLVLFLVARTGGSGLVGFLLGMFLGGGGGGGRGGGGGDDEGGGFGGFGGGSSGGGGASGDW